MSLGGQCIYICRVLFVKDFWRCASQPFAPALGTKMLSLFEFLWNKLYRKCSVDLSAEIRWSSQHSGPC